MAHFAELDSSNVVLRVVVIDNAKITHDNVEDEAKGIALCRDLFGADTNWLQTSYNGNFRKNYAGSGYRYDADLDAFIPPQPFPSWELNVAMCQWEAPKPMPQDGKPYTWNEALLRWVQYT